MTIGAALTLLDRLSSGGRKREEMSGFWAKREVVQVALDFRWVREVDDFVTLTDRGKIALEGYRRRSAFFVRTDQ